MNIDLRNFKNAWSVIKFDLSNLKAKLDELSDALALESLINIDAINKDFEDLESKINEESNNLISYLEGLSDEKDTLQEELDWIKSELISANDNLREANQELDSTKDHLRDVRLERDALVENENRRLGEIRNLEDEISILRGHLDNGF